MRNYFSATAIAFLAALMMPTIAYSVTPIEIGRTGSNIADERGCGFYKPNAEKPKLVKKLFDDGRYGNFEYEHASGRPILLLGGISSGKDWKSMAAMNINGKELLLDWVKEERIQCLDEVHHKQTQCTKREYANHDFRVIVKQLTIQSSCWPDGSECAGGTVSALVTIESVPSKTSLVMVGSCGE